MILNVKRKSKNLIKFNIYIFYKKLIFFSLWQVKGNVLQGDVQPNCVIGFSLRFKLERPGSITITYNLATSYVFGAVSYR